MIFKYIDKFRSNEKTDEYYKLIVSFIFKWFKSKIIILNMIGKFMILSTSFSWSEKI